MNRARNHQVRSKRTRTATARLFAGGTPSGLVSHLSIFRPNVAFAFDVDAELPEPELLLRHRETLKAFALARGHTADTLVARATPGIKKLVHRMAGMDAANGLGQVRGFGAQAIDEFLADPQWSRAIRETLDHLRILHNGAPDAIAVDIDGGACGGTAAGILKRLGDDVGNRLCSALGVSVHVNLCVVGKISYLGLGDGIPRNCASAIVDLVDATVCKGANPLVTRGMQLVEYPPMGREKTRRDALIRLDHQALVAIGVQEQLQRSQPNFAARGPYGAILTRKVDYYTSLDLRRDIVPIVADEYGGQLTAIVAQSGPDVTRLRHVQLREQVAAFPRPPIEEIVDHAADMTFETMLAAITRPQGRMQITAIAEMSNGETIALDRIAALSAVPPKSPAEALDRLILDETLIQVLRDELDCRDEELCHLQRKIERSKRRLRAQHTVLAGTSLAGQLRGLFSSHQASQFKAEATALALRECVDQERRIEAQIEVLNTAINAVVRERDHLRDHIREITATLQSHRPAVAGNKADPAIHVKPLEDLWNDLWELPARSQSEQEAIIAAAVQHVTVDGLARITGADRPRLDAIAERIAMRKVAIEGPHWGAKPRTDKGLGITVLPPTDPSFSDELESLIRSRNPDTHVVFAHTAEAGVNVVQFTFHTVDRIQEILTPQLTYDLAEVLSHPNRALYFPNGEDALQRLGIHYENGKVTFDGDTPSEEENP